MRSTASRYARRIAPWLLALASAAGAPADDRPAALAVGDPAKIRAVLESYRSAWLANDAEAVLRLFTEDAVLMPHHGVEPVVGKRAARAFWFPASGPPTTVMTLEQAIDEIRGACDLAYVRGHSRVEWVTGRGPEAKRFGNAGTNLTLLRRQADGSWLISAQMWDDPPNQPR